MATLNEFMDGLRRDVKAYNDFRAENALTAGLDLIALNRLRIQEAGLDENNKPFDPYTSGYAKQRQSKQLQTLHVDFNVTGKLNASLNPTVVGQDDGVVTIEIKPNNREDQAKVNGAFKKRGNILLNTKEEYEEVFADYDQRAINQLETLF